MLGKLRRFIQRCPINTIPIVILILLLTAAINIYVTKLEGDELTDYSATLQEQHTEQQWNEISSIINVSYTAANQNSKFLAQKVEVDLLRRYTNLDVLKQEFVTNQFSDGFYDVLKHNLLQENSAPSSLYPLSYETIVGLQQGIIAHFSNENTTKIKNPEQAPMVEWDSYIVKNPNPALAKEAIQAVLHRDSDVIFLQTSPTPNGQLDKESDMTMDTLKKAYLKYGLDGLKYYSILSPSYITDTGDIFETDDSTFMGQNKTYKMIILQSFNLKDVISKHETVFFQNEKDSIQNTTFLSEFVNLKHIKAITWSFLLFVISLFLTSIYNSEKKRIYLEEQQANEGGIEKNRKE
jgi:hypothetical protein